MNKDHPEGDFESTGGAADILLVEDDPEDAELTLSALKECRFADRVEHVDDGGEALDYIAGTGIFAKQPPTLPRLILLDLGLHKTGGLQVLRQLKTDERTKGIPIVVLTGSKLTIEVVESYKLGVNSYVIKPTSAREFAKVVAAIGHYWLQINEPPPR
jgi:two-component system response regulator